jgi:hypothetical protein
MLEPLTDRQEELLRVGVRTYLEVHCLDLEDCLDRSKAQIGRRCYLSEGRLLLPELGYGRDEDGWWIRPPGCEQTPLGHNHVLEHPVGSITIRPGISTSSWTGRLDRGRWISS